MSHKERANIGELRNQVADQCRVVSHLAKTVAGVHDDYAKGMNAGYMDSIVEQVGKRTAELMEILGDILNGMDAVDDKDDAWVDPIFKATQKLWPTRKTP